MEISVWFVIAVFTLGATVGGLLVTLQRECVAERIRNEFEGQLIASVERQAMGLGPEKAVKTATGRARNPVADSVGEEADEPDEGATGWEHVFAPTPGNASRPHAGM